MGHLVGNDEGLPEEAGIGHEGLGGHTSSESEIYSLGFSSSLYSKLGTLEHLCCMDTDHCLLLVSSLFTLWSLLVLSFSISSASHRFSYESFLKTFPGPITAFQSL